MTIYANVDKLVKAGYNMLSNDLELHDPIDWILAELDGFVIEVPTPHGRLIDADALYELLDGGYDLDFDEVPETKRELLRMITDAPTVIEAEGE